VQLWSNIGASRATTANPKSGGATVALGYVATLYLAWIGAWLLLSLLSKQVGWPGTSDARVLYWTLMKVMLWIIPATYVLRYCGIRLREAFRGNGIRSILLWGVGAGVLIGAEVIIRHWVGQQPYTLTPGWPLVSTVLISPVVEEYVFRGAVLGALAQEYRFGWANLISSVLFLGAHLPGWYFAGTLVENLTQPIGGALSIFILGLIFGYVVFRSRSITAGIVAHALNNLFSVL
jgi:membrane protease YdiL (CAAX protease family)